MADKTPMSSLRAGSSKWLERNFTSSSNWNLKYKYFLHKEEDECGGL